MSSTEEVSVKITKGNFTKVVIDKFLQDIDYEKKYKLNELKDMLTNSYKSVKEKKVVNKIDFMLVDICPIKKNCFNNISNLARY